MDVLQAPVHSGLVDVGDHHGHPQMLGEDHGQLGGHQTSPDDADLLQPAGLCLRDTGRPFGALLDQLQEGVDGVGELIGHDELPEGVHLCPPVLLPAAPRHLLEELQRTLRSRGGVARLGGHGLLCSRQRALPRLLGDVTITPSPDPVQGGGVAGYHLGGELQRVLQEGCAGIESIGDAQLIGLRALQRPVVVERIGEDHLGRALRADEAGQPVDAAPAGHQPEERLRQRECLGVLGHGPVVGGQGDLKTAAQSGAVDEGEGRDGEVLEQVVRLVAQLSHRPSLILGLDAIDRAQIRPGHEEARLAGHSEADDLSCLGPGRLSGDGLPELDQRVRPQCGGPFGAAVVQTEEGEGPRPCGQLHILDPAVGDHFVVEGVGKFTEGAEVRMFHRSHATHE